MVADIDCRHVLSFLPGQSEFPSHVTTPATAEAKREAITIAYTAAPARDENERGLEFMLSSVLVLKMIVHCRRSGAPHPSLSMLVAVER